MKNYDSYNNGHLMATSEIAEDNYEKVAKEWAEGSENLEALLLYCLKNGIVTQSSCRGHSDDGYAFVQFELNEANMKSIVKIVNRYYNLDGVSMNFISEPGNISKFSIHVPKKISELFFKDMLSQLSNGIDLEIDSLTDDMKNTLEVMMNHKVPFELLEVNYSKTNDQKQLYVFSSNQDYFDTNLFNDPNYKIYTGDGIGFESTPEKILPIIKDVSKKSDVKYDEFIKDGLKYEGINIQKFAKEMYEKKSVGEFNGFNVDGSKYTSPEEIVNAYFKNLEKAKYGFVNSNKNDSHDIKNIENDSENNISPIVANAKATIENDQVRQEEKTIVEVLPGMSIEEVARAVCGKRYICKFNNFVIDGTTYTSPEEIIDAYFKSWEEGKKKSSR